MNNTKNTKKSRKEFNVKHAELQASLMEIEGIKKRVRCLTDELQALGIHLSNVPASMEKKLWKISKRLVPQFAWEVLIEYSETASPNKKKPAKEVMISVFPFGKEVDDIERNATASNLILSSEIKKLFGKKYKYPEGGQLLITCADKKLCTAGWFDV